MQYKNIKIINALFYFKLKLIIYIKNKNSNKIFIFTVKSMLKVIIYIKMEYK